MPGASPTSTEPRSGTGHSPSPLWRTPTFLVALVATVVGFAGGAALTDGAVEDADLSAVDPAVTADFVGARTDSLTAVAQAVTSLGGSTVLVPLTLGLTVLLLLGRRWGGAAAVACGMSLSLLITVLLKSAVGRARPPVDDVLGAVNDGFAFPSGHTLNGTVFVGLLAGLVLTRCRTVAARLATLGAAVVLAAGIGLSRIYLGYHWLTDVMAGWALAVGVLGTVLLVATLLDQRARHRLHR